MSKSFREFVEEGNRRIDEGEITMARLHSVFNDWRKTIAAKKQEDDDYIPTEYASFEFGMTAYRYILDNGGTHQEAMEYAREVHNMTTTLLDEVKHNPYFHSKEVVMEHDSHPEQIAMLLDKTMDKAALKGSHTVNQQLKRLSTSKGIHDTLEGLKKTDAEQQVEIDYLKGQSVTQDADLRILREINNIPEQSPKDKAKLLKDAGISQKKIAEFLGKDTRTIRRWWKDL